MKPVAITAIVVISAAACTAGQTTSPPGARATDATDPTTPENSAHADPPPATSATPTSPDPVDAQDPGDPSMPAADDAKRILPLAVGRSWTWKGIETIRGNSTSVVLDMKVVRSVIRDGRDAFEVASTMKARTTTVFYALTGNDDAEYTLPGQPWVPTLKSPIADNATWTYMLAGTRKQTWRRQPSGWHVAAGTFSDCWQLEIHIAESMRTGDVNYQIYCRGVGLVQNVLRMGGSDYGLDYELISKNF